MSKMPVVFIGHGSPMNAIEDNSFTQAWEVMAKKIPTPKEILVISAHWYVKGTRILTDVKPKMTYDMYGFRSRWATQLKFSNKKPILSQNAVKTVASPMLVNISAGFNNQMPPLSCKVEAFL